MVLGDLVGSVANMSDCPENIHFDQCCVIGSNSINPVERMGDYERE